MFLMLFQLPVQLKCSRWLQGQCPSNLMRLFGGLVHNKQHSRVVWYTTNSTSHITNCCPAFFPVEWFFIMSANFGAIQITTNKNGKKLWHNTHRHKHMHGHTHTHTCTHARTHAQCHMHTHTYARTYTHTESPSKGTASWKGCFSESVCYWLCVLCGCGGEWEGL